MTRRRAVLPGAAAGVLATQRSKATTTWQTYTYNPVGTVASVVGFKRLIDGFEKAANSDYTVSLHLVREGWDAGFRNVFTANRAVHNAADRKGFEAAGPRSPHSDRLLSCPSARRRRRSTTTISTLGCKPTSLMVRGSR